MGDNENAQEAELAEKKERQRRKQFKRMGKILGAAWDWDPDFQDRKDESEEVVCLTDIGQKVDEQSYRLGRHGWKDFSRELSGVYHRHIHR